MDGTVELEFRLGTEMDILEDQDHLTSILDRSAPFLYGEVATCPNLRHSTSLQVGLLRGVLQCMARVPFHLPMKVTPGLTLIRHWDGRLSSKASAGLLLCGTAGAAS